MNGRTLLIVAGMIVSALVAATNPGDPLLVGLVVGVLLWVATRTGRAPVSSLPIAPVVPPPPVSTFDRWDPAPVAPTASARPQPEPVPEPVPEPWMEPTRAESRPAPPARPVRATRPLRRLREVVVSDLAVHGLAYLGVLLVFAGAFGFILVSFSRVSPSLRPVGEVSVPMALLGAAVFLRRRGAPVVATALGLLGGVLLPVVIATSLVDGIPFPPEVHGRALALTLTGAMLVLAVVYRAYVTREPHASLRYLVAPMLWSACWSLGLLLARGPAGAIDLHRWSAAQMAVVTVGVAATILWMRLRPRNDLGAPSRVAAVPGLALSYGLTIGLAAVEGWPAAAIAVAGVGAWVALEAFAEGSPVPARIAQLAVVATTGAALAPALGVATAGAIASLAFLGTLERGARTGASAPVMIAAAAGALAALGAASVEPGTTLVAFGAASAWCHARRIVERGTLEPAISIAGSIVPIPAAIASIELLGSGPALVTIGVGALVGAVAFRLARIDDGLLTWWIPAVSGALVLGTVVAWIAETAGPGVLAVAVAAGALSIAGALRPAALAVWTSAAALAWGAWLACAAAAVAPFARPIVWSAAGLAAVILASVFRRRDSAWDHVAGAGTALTLAGLAATRGDAHLIALASWCATWIVSAVAQERGEAPFVRLIARIPGGIGRHATLVPSLVAAASLPFLVVGMGERVGVFDDRRSWKGVTLACVAVGYALVVRVCVRATTRRVVATIAFALSLIAVAVTTPDPWPAITTIASLIAVVIAVGGEHRRPLMIWIAWLASAALVVLLAGRIGIAPRELPLVVLAWGALATSGGLGADDVLAGRRQAGVGVRVAWLVPPVTLGALAIPGGLACIVGSGSVNLSTWALVGAAVYLVIALQLRAGSVTAASWALLTFAGTQLSPRDPMGTTMLFVPWVAVLLVAARTVRPRRAGVDLWLRWDLAPIVVAHGTAVVALARAIVVDQMPPTWIAMAAVSLGVAIWWRRGAYAVVASVLAIGAAWAAGPGWLSLALAATSAGSGAAAVRTARGPRRTVLMAAAMASATGAWFALGAWLGWMPAHEARFTAIASAILAIAAASVVRWTAATRDWAVAIAGLAVVTAAGSIALASSLPPDEAGRLTATCSALIAAAAGAALGLVARPLRAPVARPLATGLMTAAGALAWYGLDVPAAEAAVLASATGVVATIAAVVLWRQRPGHAWSDGLLVLVGGAGLLAVAWASLSFPDRGPIEAVLLLVGICSASLGVGTGRPWLVAAAPVPLTAAWLLFASEVLTGQAQAFTVPIGIAVLVVAGIGRGVARDADAAASPELRILEYAGMVFVVSGGLVEAVATDPMRGLGALLGGVAIACWGALTHVRRRVAFGACAVFVAAVEIPILSVIPTLRTVTAPAVWAGLVAAGVVILAIATGMERHRTRIRTALGRIDTLMEGWE